MDNIWFGRLTAYVEEGLGDLVISLETLSQVTVLVTEFVDSFQSNLANRMTSTEKHLLAVTWIDRLVFDYCDGRRLSPDVAKLNSEYISRICEISKGRTKLNGADQVFLRGMSNSVAVVAPKPKKVRFSFFRSESKRELIDSK